MKLIPFIILIFKLSIGADTYDVIDYESTDLNNNFGPKITTETDIIQITFTEYFISLKGRNKDSVDVGKHYEVTNVYISKTQPLYYSMVIEEDNNIFMINFFLTLNKLTIYDNINDKFEIYHLKVQHQ